MNEIVRTSAGWKCRSAELWLDAHRPVPSSFVSDARVDPVARHERMVATAATVALLGRRGRMTQALPVSFGQPFTYGPLRLELLPAGHILGSAQLRIEKDGERIVYAAAVDSAASRTAEPLVPARCETLILDATFGDPRYRFPSPEKSHERMARFAEDALAGGETAIFFADELGAAQEVARVLGERGFSPRLHADAWRFAEVYLEQGVRLPQAAPLSARPKSGEVVIAPPRLVGSRWWQRMGRSRTCLVASPTALPPAADEAERGAHAGAQTSLPLAVQAAAPVAGRSKSAGVDRTIVLAQRADFEGLVAYARATGASNVLTFRGHAETLARELRGLGIDASPLEGNSQLRLF